MWYLVPAVAKSADPRANRAGRQASDMDICQRRLGVLQVCSQLSETPGLRRSQNAAALLLLHGLVLARPTLYALKVLCGWRPHSKGKMLLCVPIQKRSCVRPVCAGLTAGPPSRDIASQCPTGQWIGSADQVPYCFAGSRARDFRRSVLIMRLKGTPSHRWSCYLAVPFLVRRRAACRVRSSSERPT